MGILNNILKTKDGEEDVVKSGEVVAEKTAKKVKTSSANSQDTKNAYKALITPLISEKATAGVSMGKYSFIVNDKTNKSEVKKAVFAVYGIKPVAVNIANVAGKAVRFGKTSGTRKDWKKATVTLPEGKTIQLYEGI